MKIPNWLYWPNIKILNLTHDDLDGAVSAIVVTTIFPTAEVVQTNYKGSGRYIKAINAIKAGGYDAIIFSDFCPDEEMVREIHYANKPYLVIDHHPTAEIRNDYQGTYFVQPGQCGAMLCLEYLANMANLGNLDHLRTLCEVTNDHDLWQRKMVPLSDQLNTLFYEYGFNGFMEHFKKGMDGYKLSEKDNALLATHDQEVQDYMIRCTQHKLPYNGYYIELEKFNSDINLLLGDKYDWIVMCGTAEAEPGMSKLSFRTSRTDVDLGAILKEMGRGGGGHPGAAGQVIPTREKDAFIQEFADKAFGNKKD